MILWVIVNPIEAVKKQALGKKAMDRGKT